MVARRSVCVLVEVPGYNGRAGVSAETPLGLAPGNEQST
jgi:hypothetical protein